MKYTVEVRENEYGEEFTVLFDSDGNEIATQWGEVDLSDFAEDIRAHEAKNPASETPVAQRESATEGQAKPTPIPWKIGKDSIFIFHPFTLPEIPTRICTLNSSVGDEIKAANAELIVKAVNNHSRLVEALKLLLEADIYADGEGWMSFQSSDTENGEKAIKFARQVLKDLGETQNE